MSNNDDTIDKKVVCIYQAFKSPRQGTGTFSPKGWGDCSRCHYDLVNNKMCRGYYPITINYVRMKEYEEPKIII